MDYLPSKKFIIFISIILGIGGFFLVVLNFIQNKNVFTQDRHGVVGSISRDNLTERDFDKDGLKDWEEYLIGSDPENPDANNNGVLDGKEITADQKQTLPRSPEGLLSAIYAGEKPVTLDEAVFGKKNLTDELSRDAAAYYTSFQNIKQLDEKTLTETIVRLAKNIVPLPEKNKMSRSDIAINKENNITGVNRYLNEFLKTLADYLGIYEANPLQEIDIWIETNDNASLKNVRVLERAYTAFAGKIKKIEVPDDLADIHLTLINSLYHSASALQDIQTLESDPVRGTIGAFAYTLHTEQRQNALAELIEKVKTYTE